MNVPSIYIITLGYVCAIMSSSAGIPQVIKTIKNKSSKDLSYGFLCLTVTSLGGWTLYGIFLMDFPVIACNVISFVIYTILLAFKVHNEKKTNTCAYTQLTQIEVR